MVAKTECVYGGEGGGGELDIYSINIALFYY